MRSLVMAAMLAASTLTAQTTDVRTVAVAASSLLWTATKVTGEHTGGVPLKSGTIVTKDGQLEHAEVVLDLTALTCIDIESESANAKLVAHLKSADFFDVANHPTAHFKTTSIKVLADATPGKPNLRVTGDLTIKGITKPNTFDCIYWLDGTTLRAAANLTFDRTHYGIRYRSGSFFSDLGDKAISDTVSLTFDIAAK